MTRRRDSGYKKNSLRRSQYKKSAFATNFLGSRGGRRERFVPHLYVFPVARFTTGIFSYEHARRHLTLRPRQLK